MHLVTRHWERIILNRLVINMMIKSLHTYVGPNKATHRWKYSPHVHMYIYARMVYTRVYVRSTYTHTYSEK